jgi:two-component system chemotaxis response regulator CheY
MDTHAISPLEKPAGMPGQPLQNSRQRILVVEDEPNICRFNTEMLRRAGYQVDGVADGALAWDALLLNRYDLVVTDNNMPNVSGVELMEMIHRAHMLLPVIMATGTLPTLEFARQPWLHPAAMLIKPYTSGELLETVKNVLDPPAAARKKLASPESQSHSVAGRMQR